MTSLTDEEHVTFADKVIGYVSEGINNEKTGELAYNITDGNSVTRNQGEINHVTIIY